MAIHVVKGEDFHSKFTSYTTCRLAGRMAIHVVKGEDFHSKFTSYTTCRLDVLEWEAVELYLEICFREAAFGEGVSVYGQDH